MDNETSVLIVEGDEAIGRSLGELLESSGHYVERVKTGAEASTRAADRFFNVALVALDLADTRGTDLLRRLEGSHPAMDGIILGRDVTAEVAAKVMQEGAFACLASPPDPEVLLETIDRALRKQRLECERRDRHSLALVSTLAHEIRSPLTSIVLSANLLAEELPPNVPASLVRLTENIVQSARRIDGWLQELMDLSKMRAGDYHLELVLVDPKMALQDVATAARPEIESKGQALTLELAEPLPEVTVDRQRVEQAVAKLLAIACKSTPSGGGIVLRARQEDASLVVEIEDGAPAIPQEVLVRLSSAHHRVETDKRDIARVGLGLAISGQLVALHGGKMWIESGVRGDGEGNVYGFTLPLE